MRDVRVWQHHEVPLPPADVVSRAKFCVPAATSVVISAMSSRVRAASMPNPVCTSVGVSSTITTMPSSQFCSMMKMSMKATMTGCSFWMEALALPTRWLKIDCCAVGWVRCSPSPCRRGGHGRARKSSVCWPKQALWTANIGPVSGLS